MSRGSSTPILAMDFEVFAVLLALAFVVVPFPFCIFLLVRQRKLGERIRRLEKQLAGLHPQTPVSSKMPGSARSVSGAQLQAPMAHVEKVQSAAASSEEASTKQPSVHSGLGAVPIAPSVPVAHSTASPAGTQKDHPRSAVERTDAGHSARHSGVETGKGARAPAGARGLSDLLRSVGMLPPEKGMGIESGWIQWVAPRLGGVFAVLAVLFFGVYVAQNAKPWVRFLEAFAVSGAVFGCGMWLRGRNRSYGSILSTVGLGMIYTTVIAGYAAPAIRVIESPWVGMLAQMAVVILSMGLAMRWADRGIVLFSLLLGMGTSVFSAWVGLQEAALAAGVLVLASGYVFAVRWDWRPCLVFALIGSSLPLWTWVVQDGLEMVKELPYEAAVLGYLALIALSCGALLHARKGSEIRLFASAGTLATLSGAILLLSGYAWSRWVVADLEDFYGVMACVYLLIAVISFRRDESRGAFTVYAVEASFLLTFWAVLALNTEARWLFVTLQGTSLAFLARRRKSIWIELLSIGTFAYGSIWMIKAMPVGLPMASLRSWIYYAYGLLGLGTLAWLHGGTNNNVPRKWSYSALGGAVAVLAYDVIRTSGVEVSWQIRLLLLGGVLSAFLAYIPGMRRWPLFAGFALLLVLSSRLYWVLPQHVPGGFAVVLVCLGTIGMSWVYKRTMSRRQQVFSEWFLDGLAVVSMQVMMLQILPDQWHALWACAFALILAFMSLWQFRALGDWIFLPLVLFGFDDPEASASIWTRIVLPGIALVGFGWSAWFHPARIRSFVFLRWRRLWTVVLSLSSIIWWNWLGSNWPVWLHFVVWSIAGALLMLPVVRFRRVSWAVAGWTLAQIVVWGIAFSQWMEADYHGGNTPVRNVSFLWAGALVSGMAWVSIYWLGRWARIGVSHSSRRMLLWLHSILLIGGSMLWIAYPPLDWNAHYTPLWAVIAFAGVLCGVGMKCRPLRIVSLLFLLIPIVRLFAYDVTQTLHRIIAFAALSVMLLVLGYIYQRIRPSDEITVKMD